MTVKVIGRTGASRGVDRTVADTMQVGSGPGNDLQVDAVTVSRQHAKIVRSGDVYYLEDLGSRNGTFLNGQRVRRFPIRHLDVFSVGPDVDFIFLETAATVPRGRAASVVRASIEWTSGPFAPGVEQISPDRPLEVGRRGERTALAAVSRRHAAINIAGDRITIEDLGSANGTFVNGQRIAAITELGDGDQVTLADQIGFRVSVEGTAPARRDLDAATQVIVRATIPETALHMTPAPSRPQEPPVPVPAIAPAAPPAAPAMAAPPMAAAAPAVSMPPTEPLPEEDQRTQAWTSPAVGPLPNLTSPSAPPEDATVVASRTAMAPPVFDRTRESVIPPAAALPRESGAGEPREIPEDGTMVGMREGAAVPVFRALDQPTQATAAKPPEMPPETPSGEIPTQLAAPGNYADDLTVSAVFDGDSPTGTDLRVLVPPSPVPSTASIIEVRLEGQQRFILRRGTVLIGRHAEADIRIDARDVGRRHARLLVRDDAVVVEDLGTDNGTFVDDERITGECALHDGCRLRFATVEFGITFVRSEGR